MKPLLEKGNGEKRLEYVKLHNAQKQTSCENRSSKEMRKSQTTSREKSNSEFLQPWVKLSRGSYEGLGLHFTHWCLGSCRNWWIYEGRKELLDFNPPCNTISQNNSRSHGCTNTQTSTWLMQCFDTSTATDNHSRAPNVLQDSWRIIPT